MKNNILVRTMYLILFRENILLNDCFIINGKSDMNPKKNLKKVKS